HPVSVQVRFDLAPRLRTAVGEMHRECDVEGCHVTTNLEIDHNQPVEEFGKTELRNLGRLCLHHHHHEHRHRLRLEGPPGRMCFVPAPIPGAICSSDRPGEHRGLA